MQFVKLTVLLFRQFPGFLLQLLDIFKEYLKQNPITGNVEMLHNCTVEVDYVPCNFGVKEPSFILVP
jgi:hypothetical protein